MSLCEAIVSKHKFFMFIIISLINFLSLIIQVRACNCVCVYPRWWVCNFNFIFLSLNFILYLFVFFIALALVLFIQDDFTLRTFNVWIWILRRSQRLFIFVSPPTNLTTSRFEENIKNETIRNDSNGEFVVIWFFCIKLKSLIMLGIGITNWNVAVLYRLGFGGTICLVRVSERGYVNLNSSENKVLFVFLYFNYFNYRIPYQPLFWFSFSGNVRLIVISLVSFKTFKLQRQKRGRLCVSEIVNRQKRRKCDWKTCYCQFDLRLISENPENKRK